MYTLAAMLATIASIMVYQVLLKQVDASEVYTLAASTASDNRWHHDFPGFVEVSGCQRSVYASSLAIIASIMFY